MAKQATNAPRGMYKRGEVWYSRIAGADGKLIRVRLSADKQTATIMLAELRRKVELQRFGIIPEKVTEEIKDVAVLKQKYLDHLKTTGRRDTTIKWYEFAWKYALEQPKIKKIEDITVARMEELAVVLKERGTRAQTINAYVKVIRCALAWAREMEYIRKNPLSQWEHLKHDAPRKRRDMTQDEIKRFFLAETDSDFSLLWLIYFRTGLRASAGLKFAWEWMDWKNQGMTLPAKDNKSRVDFWLPLDDHVFTALKRRYDALGPERAVGRVFKTMTICTLRRRFRKICTAAGIELDGLCLHSIRHTYATVCFESSGHNVKVVQELMCHANGATTLKYIHVSHQEKRETINRNALRLQADNEEWPDAAAGS